MLAERLLDLEQRWGMQTPWRLARGIRTVPGVVPVRCLQAGENPESGRRAGGPWAAQATLWGCSRASAGVLTLCPPCRQSAG